MGDPFAAGGDPSPNLEQNIDSLLEVRKRERQQRPPSHRIVDRIGLIIARPMYLAAIIGFAGVWIAANMWLPRMGRAAFDASPFPILDGILSLAALVSTTIILIAQNRQTRIEQQHMHISLQVNLMTEQKVTKIIDLLEELRRDMPMVKNRYDAQAASFAQETDALQVLTAIEASGLTKDPTESDVLPAGEFSARGADRNAT